MRRNKKVSKLTMLSPFISKATEYCSPKIKTTNNRICLLITRRKLCMKVMFTSVRDWPYDGACYVKELVTRLNNHESIEQFCDADEYELPVTTDNNLNCLFAFPWTYTGLISKFRIQKPLISHKITDGRT